MIIRTATVDDAASIARVHVSSWRTTYAGIVPQAHLDGLDESGSAAALQKRLADNERDDTHVVAEMDECGIVGFASFGPNRKSGLNYDGEIYAIYVLEQYQRHGIGRLLFNESVRRLIEHGHHSMLLAVIAQNSARGFYEHLGGKIISTDEIPIGGKLITGVCYGWEDLRNLEISSNQ